MNTPRMLCDARAGLLVLLSLGTASAHAVSVTSGSGSAVTIIDRSATFGSITQNGIPLSEYSEDLLDISSPGLSAVGFTAFTSGAGIQTEFYYAGQNTEYITITATDGIDIYGLELLLGHGYTGTLNASLVWETYSNNAMTASGQIDTTRGTVIGWSDATGFDELRVGAGVRDVPGTPDYTGFGDSQAIAIDDLKVQVTALPLPAAVWLFGSGLLGLIGIGRMRRQT